MNTSSIQNWISNTIDDIVNYYLVNRNFLLFKIFGIKNGNFCIPKNYACSRFDDFTSMSISDFNNKYLMSEPWGDYHPAQFQEWYDPSGVSLNSSGLNLSVTNNTKVVTTYDVNGVLKDNEPPVTILHGVGLVTSKNSYNHGIYECNVILPSGLQLWPAFWLSGLVTWPPEIDIVEGNSTSTGVYGKNIGSNIHLGNPNAAYALGGKNYGSFVDTTKEIKFQCWWTSDYIRIYYNGFLCRIMTNKSNMSWFNQNMIVIINNGLQEVMPDQVTGTPFIIKSFKFYNLT